MHGKRGIQANISVLLVIVLLASMFTGLNVNQLSVLAEPEEYIVTVADAENYSETAVAGASWNNHSWMAADENDQAKLRMINNGAGSTATFKLPSDATAGTYEIHFYVSHASMANNDQTIAVNGQDTGFEKSGLAVGWYRLGGDAGVYALKGDGTDSVVITAGASYARATSIKFVKTAEAPPAQKAEYVVKAEDPANSPVNYSETYTTKDWSSHSWLLADSDDPDSRARVVEKSAGNTASFKLPQEAEGGNYEIYFNITHTSMTNNDLTITINGTDANYQKEGLPAGWYRLGGEDAVWELKGDGTDVVVATAGSGWARATSIRFVKTDEAVPSPKPSPVITLMKSEDNEPGVTKSAGWGGSTGMQNSRGSELNTWYCGDKDAYVQFAPSGLTEGWYDVEFWNIKFSDTNPIKMKAEVFANGETNADIALSANTEGADRSGKWDSVGTYYFKGTGDEYLKLIATGGNFARVGDVRFVKNDSYDPSVSPSPKPSPSPSPSPTPTPSVEPGVVYMDTQFNDGTLNGWTAFVATIEPTDKPSAENKSMKVTHQGSTQAGLNAPALSKTAVGKVVLDTAFNMESVHTKTTFLARATGGVYAHVEFEKLDGAIRLAYYDGANDQTLSDSGYVYSLNNWYRMILVFDTATATYDINVYDTDNNYLVDQVKGVKAKATGITVQNADVKSVDIQNHNRNAEADVTSVWYMDYMKVFDGTGFELPDMPEVPKPSPTPQNTFYYDDGDSNVFELVWPNGAPDNTGNKYFGNSSTGNSSYNSSHTFCNNENGYGLFTLKNAPSGVYEVYYHIPLVHTNNSKCLTLDLTDSTGQTFHGEYDTQAVANIGDHSNNVNAAGDIKTGTWLKLGDSFTLNSSNPGTIKVGKIHKGEEELQGFFRMDAVRIVRLSTIESAPFARNLTIDGALSPDRRL